MYITVKKILTLKPRSDLAAGLHTKKYKHYSTSIKNLKKEDEASSFLTFGET